MTTQKIARQIRAILRAQKRSSSVRPNPPTDFLTLAISASSLIVALGAAYATYQQARVAERAFELDSTFRELSIRPQLAFAIDANDMSVKITNLGGGSAVIKSIDFDFRDLHFHKNGDTSRDTDVIEFVNGNNGTVIEHLFGNLMGLKQSMEGGQLRILLQSSFQIPATGAFINPSDGFFIFKTDQSGLDRLKAAAEAHSADYNAFTRGFLRNVTDMRLTVSYCSLTGKHCNVGHMNTGLQKAPRL